MTWLQQAQEVGVRVEEPLVLADANRHPWDERADLVVVGLGAAGVSAALEAVEAGAQVFALDRYEGGGSTVVSSGVIYAGGGTHVQQQAGVIDSPLEMYRYLKADMGDAVSDAALRDFTAQSAATVAWLARHGVRFDAKHVRSSGLPHTPRASQADDGSGLQAPLLPQPDYVPARGHRVALSAHAGKAWGLGGALYGPLCDAALQGGMEFSPFSEVRQLVQDTAGRVVGVKVVGVSARAPASVFARLHRYAARVGYWQGLLPPSLPFASLTYRVAKYYLRHMAQLQARWQQVRWIRADHGVLLSAGGFALNPRMVQRYAPAMAPCMPNGTSGDNGSGILLGMSVGGAVARMDQSMAWRFLAPAAVVGGGIAVNQLGQRFVNEAVHSAALGQAICAQPQGRAWLVYDASQRRLVQAHMAQAQTQSLVRDAVRLNLWFNEVKAASVAGLARKLHLPAQALEATVAHYNAQCEQAHKEAAAKMPGVEAAEHAHPHQCAVSTGPFYAMDIGVRSRWMPMAALPQGGLQVHEGTGQVLNAQGQPIAGLYAAGRSAVGLLAGACVGGMALADSVFAGRRAARDVARKALAAAQLASADIPSTRAHAGAAPSLFNTLP